MKNKTFSFNNEKETYQIFEDKKSEYSFQGESFYEIGHGFESLRGPFTRYATKSGIDGIRFPIAGIWEIDSKDYEYVDGQFILVQHKETETVAQDNKFQVPIKIIPKTVAAELISVKPLDSIDTN